MTINKGLDQLELYDKRFDWLVTALAAIPLIWLFYGFEASFICFLLFIAIAGLKPLIKLIGSRMAAGIVAAGTLLLLSPLLRYAFYDGFCFDGAWSIAKDISRYQIPDLCERGLLSHVDQEIWIGPLRDLAMPVAGIGLILFAGLDAKGRQLSLTGGSDCDPEKIEKQQLRYQQYRWIGLILSLVIWVAATALNYQAEQNLIEENRQAEIIQQEKEAAAARAEELRIEVEEKAKRVEREWLLGAWVAIDESEDSPVANPKLYCATDTAITFKTDGSYSEFDEEGKFVLKNNEITFLERMSYPDTFSDEFETPEQLETVTSQVERNGDRLVMNEITYGRC